jgi:heat shock protein HtpX
MTRFVNNFKTVLLMGGLTGLLVAVGGMLGNQFILPFLVIAILMNVGMWFFSDRLALSMLRAREVDPRSPDGAELVRLVDELRRRAGLPMPRVYICPHEAPNAFATGRSPRRSAVAVTQGLLRLLDRHELEGVIAHELAHIKNRDTLTSCIAATVSGVLASIAQWGFLLGGGQSREGSNPLIALFTVIFAAVGAALLKAAISRGREYVADADGAAIAGTPAGLASGLRKLDAWSRRIPLDHPNPALNNLFIVEPLSGNSALALFSTHPPIEKRIAALLRGHARGFSPEGDPRVRGARAGAPGFRA